MKGRKPKPAKLRSIDGGKAAAGAGEKPAPQTFAGVECGPPVCPDVVADKPFAKAAWDRFVPELVKAGFMATIYEGTFATWCVAYARWVDAEAELAKTGLVVKSPKGYPIQNPYLAIANRMMKLMNDVGEGFGMSPIAVARAQRLAQGELFGDDFGDWFGRRNRGA